MSVTTFGAASPQTVQKWSTGLWIDQRAASYFEQKFIGTSINSVIQRMTDLESGAGDRVKFDLSVALRGQPTFGDDRAEGSEENQRYYQDEVFIDQVRKPVSCGGEMTRKRTVHDLRSNAKAQLADFFAKFTDELFFMYLGGGRGSNEDFLMPSTWTGHAGNPFQAPDAEHLLYGGAATSKSTLTAADKMNRAVIEKALNRAEMMQARNPDAANMVPVKNGSEGNYVFLMNPDQEFDLRNDPTTGNWMDLQKAAAAAEGRDNPLFKGNLGMIGGAVLHKHRSVIRFSDYGAGGNVSAARALLLGRQAAVVAYGTSGGMRYTWKEKMKDFDNEPAVSAGCIFGVKKTRFNGRDFGVMSIDTAAKDPTV
jgi:N4-gp56 family major capsid protein